MDIADLADKFIEDQVLTSVMKIRQQAVAKEEQKRIATRQCEVCDGVIPKARLRVVPGCSLCITCASRQEREKAGIFTAADQRQINGELDDFLLSIC